MDSGSADLQLLSDEQTNSWATCGATAWLVFEIALTLYDEIKFVWKSRWSIPKVLYFISRYLGLASSLVYTAITFFDLLNDAYAESRDRKCAGCLRDTSCNDYSVVLTACIELAGTVADGLLFLRVLALFGQRRRSTVFIMRLALKIIFGIETCAQYVLLFLSIASTVTTPVADTWNDGCLSTVVVSPNLIMLGLLPSLLFNALIFSITVYELLPYYREGSWTPLFTLFLRDGALYSGMLCSMLLTVIITIEVFADRPGIVFIAIPWLIVVPPIASCRLLLNLRGTLRADQPGSSTLPTAQAEASVMVIDIGLPSGTTNPETTWGTQVSMEGIELESVRPNGMM